MATLFVTKGRDQGKRYDLAEEIVSVGRESGNTIRLHDTEVSRCHAEFRKQTDGILLVDLESSNGTFVNNRRIENVLLRAGDQIQIGQTFLVYTPPHLEQTAEHSLAERISMISRSDLDIPASIVKAVREEESNAILTEPTPATGPLANLKVMYDAAQAVSHILDTDELLERIMDLVFQSIPADRGCVMLQPEDNGPLRPHAVRWREGVDRQHKITISRTIMDYVLKEKQGVLVSDAGRDERFSPAQSIVRFGIREALCVPMKGRHETLGVMYLDTRLKPKEFLAQKEETAKLNEDHLRLAIAIGRQAALALEETRYYKTMIQQERLAAVGQTIAAISHHVKNILQGLRSGNDLLKVGIQEKDNEMLQRAWRIVESNQMRIYDLVMDMLSYSKDREPALVEADLNHIVNDVVELVQPRIENKNIRLKLKLTKDLPTVPVDPEGLHKALLNILGNAVDAVEDRPSPVISVHSGLVDNDEWAELSVHDNGPGIPDSMLTDIFRPFVSTKGSKGTGLGLAVSRKILREHGGDLTVKTIPGKGSRFDIRLPVNSPLSLDSSSEYEIEVPPGE